MMPMAMAFVGLELLLMSWLIVESIEIEVNPFGRNAMMPRSPAPGEARQ